jgi:hypothetical protein
MSLLPYQGRILKLNGLGKDTQPLLYLRGLNRETREGWPLLTVETDARLMEYKCKGSFLSLFFGFLPVHKILPCLGCSSQPSTKYFFPSPHTFSLYVSQATT